MRIQLEVIATSAADARAAEEGGADRIELVADLPQGGTTPEPRVIEAARRAVSIPIYVMIRPRGGDFAFTAAEIEAMAADARRAREAGADGIVTGALRADGTVDVEATARVAEAASLPVTFHRAFDEAADLFAALDALARIPHVERVLTSGGRASAWEGRAVIAALRRASPVEVMAGAGITAANVAPLIKETGVRAVHVGSAARRPAVPTAPVSVHSVQRLRRLIDGATTTPS